MVVCAHLDACLLICRFCAFFLAQRSVQNAATLAQLAAKHRLSRAQPPAHLLHDMDNDDEYAATATPPSWVEDPTWLDSQPADSQDGNPNDSTRDPSEEEVIITSGEVTINLLESHVSEDDPPPDPQFYISEYTKIQQRAVAWVCQLGEERMLQSLKEAVCNWAEAMTMDMSIITADSSVSSGQVDTFNAHISTFHGFEGEIERVMRPCKKLKRNASGEQEEVDEESQRLRELHISWA